MNYLSEIYDTGKEGDVYYSDDTSEKRIVIGGINADFEIRAKAVTSDHPNPYHEELGMAYMTHTWRYVQGDDSIYWWNRGKVPQDHRDEVAHWLKKRGYGNPTRHRPMVLNQNVYDNDTNQWGQDWTHFHTYTPPSKLWGESRMGYLSGVSNSTRFLGLFERDMTVPKGLSRHPNPEALVPGTVEKNPNYDEAKSQWVYRWIEVNQNTGRKVRLRAYHPKDLAANFIRYQDRVVGKASSKLPEILNSTEEIDNDTEAVVRLLAVTGLRIGSPHNSTRGQPTFGLSTLLCQHAAARGPQVRLTFLGKSGKQNSVSFDDAPVAAYIRKKKRGCQDERPLFPDTTAVKVRQRLKEFDRAIYPKALRTVRANDLATTFLMRVEITGLEGMSDSQRKNAIKKALAQCWKHVSETLQNSPNEAKNSYIDPRIVMKWLKSLGFTGASGVFNHPALTSESVTGGVVANMVDPHDDEDVELAMDIDRWLNS